MSSYGRASARVLSGDWAVTVKVLARPKFRVMTCMAIKLRILPSSNDAKERS
ncbi:hypothetical protein BJY26_001285 [Spelaeicoccus albus]|uniref:Uncharacterized protein n=1 Tax=Spelaeicoccus albus TaxID=1280376 RepID=A0A7Z0A9P6_9MICO|nr:hypothetical protein [Spelaeicoccus albus]